MAEIEVISQILYSRIDFRITFQVSPTTTDLVISSGTVSRDPLFNESHWRQILLLCILCGILPDEWAAVTTQITE